MNLYLSVYLMRQYQIFNHNWIKSMFFLILILVEIRINQPSRPNKVSSKALASWERLVCNFALPELIFPENARIAPRAATPPSPTFEVLAVCTASAFPIMGQRRAMVCRLDMLPPPGEAWRVAVVERERRVAGEVFFKNGHMDFDCRRTESMVAIWSGGLSLRLRLSVFSCFFCQQKMVIEWC